MDSHSNPYKQEVVSGLLIDILHDIMSDPVFADFRLVGGTNLALQSGHRVSTDIDLFTDREYGSLDFKKFETWFRSRYKYFEPTSDFSIVGRGRTYYVGDNIDNAVKLDLMYEDEKFLYPVEVIDGVRMATVEEIAVMKLDAIFRGGRKKDFWDLHHLVLDIGLDLGSLILLHSRRFEYQHDHDLMIKMLQDFSKADDEPDPICRYGKFWEVIKLDILDWVDEVSGKKAG